MSEEDITWICPRCNNTVPTFTDPLLCDQGHPATSMMPVTERAQPSPVTIGTKRVPTGPLKYAAFTLFLLVFVSVLAWIWLGQWQWGPTAAVMLFGGIFVREGSLKVEKPLTLEDWLGKE